LDFTIHGTAILTGTITIPITGVAAGIWDYHIIIRHGVLACHTAIPIIHHGILHGTIVRTGEVTDMEIITGITIMIITGHREESITEAVTRYQALAEPGDL